MWTRYGQGCMWRRSGCAQYLPLCCMNFWVCAWRSKALCQLTAVVLISATSKRTETAAKVQRCRKRKHDSHVCLSRLH